LLLCAGAIAQTAPDKYWIRFTDKDQTPFSIEQPSAFLSERAIERRIRQNIAVDERDLPIDPAYIQAVTDIPGVQFWHHSRWFNAITVKLLEPEALSQIQALPFVAETRSVQVLISDRAPETLQKNSLQNFSNDAYGEAFKQIEMLRGHLLHAAGFSGEGMHIAVMDAGFGGVPNMEAFAHAHAEDRIIQVANYVIGGSDVTNGGNHGTRVLSTMAGQQNNRYLGTAPNATYLLFQTEDVGFEFRIEEDN
jgi:serine protease AprX